MKMNQLSSKCYESESRQFWNLFCAAVSLELCFLNNERESLYHLRLYNIN
jgi:hypothetical protein